MFTRDKMKINHIDNSQSEPLDMKHQYAINQKFIETSQV